MEAHLKAPAVGKICRQGQVARALVPAAAGRATNAKRAAVTVMATPPEAPGAGTASAPGDYKTAAATTTTTTTTTGQTASNLVVFPSPAVVSSAGKPGGKMAPMDGNEATALIAYAVSDVSFIYPITPATNMGEMVDQWASEGRTNVFNNVMSVTEMESETGAAGALHGALAAGALATTFTCSQGLLLMVPNMYKIAGELTPCVLHVTARALAKHALSIFGDHQDVMAVRQTGWAMLCSHSVQEAHDLALVSHLATLRASVPFVHFFDGFRTSHEINTIHLIDNEAIKSILAKPIYQDAIKHHRARALNPTHPHQRGTAQGPDVYFQCAEAANPFYDRAYDHVAAAMEEVSAVTGRVYKPYEYVGAPDADKVIVLMGSGSAAVEEAVNYLDAQGKKVGVLKVRLYRPWNSKVLLAQIPATVRKVAVLDRTKEPGSGGEPLYQQIAMTLHEAEMADPALPRRYIVGGRFGLASKEFLPSHAAAVFENLDAKKPLRDFSVGIMDDVTHRSLPDSRWLPLGTRTLPKGTFECLFWGMGSDGTVGANKEAIKIIASSAGMSAQAYFSYDAHKSGGVTVSHLRFGPSPIDSPYLVQQADYLAVNHQSYMAKYDTLASLKPGGVLVLNTVFTSPDSLGKYLPDKVKKQIAALKPQLYVIDAQSVAKASGLGKHVNMVMQTVFFNLSGVLPMEKALALLKKSITKAYERKGPEVVAKNHSAVDMAVAALKKLDIPASWSSLPTHVVNPNPPAEGNTSRWEFIETVAKPMLALEGDKLPVSVFSPEGFVPPGTTVIEKRAIAAQVPIWKAENCTQCNICAFVCPHAAIRPALASPADLVGAPATFGTIQAKGPGMGDFKYRIQVSPYDCTGCDLCTHACPDDALQSVPINSVLEVETANWDFTGTLPARTDIMDKATVKGSQLQPPLMEFSGACEGCGETPYVKLLTQLFGDRLIIANATGCSSIWGGSAPSNPYTTNADGYGPAWANSLFEDNAQFGLGIAMGTMQRRKTVRKHVQEVLAVEAEKMPLSFGLRNALTRWDEHFDEPEVANVVAKELQPLLEREKDVHPWIRQLYDERDMLHKASIWIVGGDGWAYDIGFGGLDHVLASGENVNILVLDTEVYSNTGGQRSKATPKSAVTKFAAGGKERPKKDLGAIAMSYGDVYVASTSLHANYGQVTKAMAEAEKYGGVSLVLAYAPCIMHGISSGMCSAIDESKQAVETGYWPLYRYNPAVKEDATHHRFQLDAKKLKGDVEEWLSHENRFQILERKNPEVAHKLHHELDDAVHERFDRMKHMAAGGHMEPGSPPPPAAAAPQAQAPDHGHQHNTKESGCGGH
uniref:pyruvate dehydrogenase (NADP(+)) n=1 Tax=Chlamydomonas reinhardtii TaxID=3055 RepID=L8B958_CHLRE|nr:pyruvate ferredoxin oxidoreductase [Chlamydomonas reinhardtii]